MFVGTDSTWLWRQNVGDRFFYKFWGQAIRFVGRTEDAGNKKSWIEVKPVRAAAGRGRDDRTHGPTPSDGSRRTADRCRSRSPARARGRR